jgi:excisionase family DNA binding protein
MGTKAISADDLITTAEAAGLLGRSPRQVRQHAANGNLPGRQVGRDWLFRRADVLAARATLPGRGRPKKS